MNEQALEVGRYRITVGTSEQECRTVLTCKDCPTAPVEGHPELVVVDPPISIYSTYRPGPLTVGISAIVPAMFHHEIGRHPPQGTAVRSGNLGAMEVTADGLRSLAKTLDELSVLTRGEIGLSLTDVSITGGLNAEDS